VGWRFKFWGQDMFRTVRIVASLSLFFATLCGTVASAGVQIGDQFSGTFSIDPNAPLTVFNANTIFSYGDLPPVPPLGTITLTFSSGTFSAPVLIVSNQLRPDGTWTWDLQASTFGSAPTNASINIIFAGSTPSTSILPLNLSPYDDPQQLLNRQNLRAAIEIDGGLAVSGEITSLIKLDEQGDFSYAGEFVSISSSVPEPSTWAMLLIGFAGIGIARYRRSHRVLIMADWLTQR